MTKSELKDIIKEVMNEAADTSELQKLGFKPVGKV